MKQKETKITVRLEPEFVKEIKKHCEENGFSISARVRKLLRDDIKKFKKLNEDG